MTQIVRKVILHIGIPGSGRRSTADFIAKTFPQIFYIDIKDTKDTRETAVKSLLDTVYENNLEEDRHLNIHGVPWTYQQAVSMTRKLCDISDVDFLTLHHKVSKDTATERLKKREQELGCNGGKEGKCSWNTRLSHYLHTEDLILSHLHSVGSVYEIDAEKELKKAFVDVVEILEPHFMHL